MKKRVLWIVLFIIFILITCFFFSKKDEKKKFIFWSIQLKPVYEKQIEKIIADFENKHQDYKVVWVDIPIQEAQKRTLASILSSNPPDLINLNPEFSLILAQRDALYLFDDEIASAYNKNLVNKLKYRDKIYGLPFYATSPVTIYNKEIYNKCVGTEFIKSYNDLEKIAKKVKECANIAVFSGSINENDSMAKILNKYDIYDFNSEKQNKKAVKVFSMFNKLYKNDELPKDILTINHRENVEKYMSNHALIIVAGSNFINMIKQNASDIYLKSSIASQLTGKNGKYDVALMNLVIPKKSKNIELAKEFALVLTNQQNQLELSKLTNVLPANKFALEDNYFKNCSSDLVQKSRCVSALQLNNLSDVTFGEKNKKLINEEINSTLEEILLSSKISNKEISEKVQKMSSQIKMLQN